MRWWPIRGRARRLPPPPPPDEMLVIEDRLRRNVEDVLSIRDRQIRGGIVVFRGSLTTEPARALDLLIARFRPFGYTPYLREEAGGAAVQAWPVAETAPRWRIGVNLALFALTVVSTLAAGLSFVGSPTFDALRSTPSAARFLAGAPFAFTLLAILGEAARPGPRILGYVIHGEGRWPTCHAFGRDPSAIPPGSLRSPTNLEKCREGETCGPQQFESAFRNLDDSRFGIRRKLEGPCLLVRLVEKLQFDVAYARVEFLGLLRRRCKGRARYRLVKFKYRRMCHSHALIIENPGQIRGMVTVEQEQTARGASGRVGRGTRDAAVPRPANLGCRGTLVQLL